MYVCKYICILVYVYRYDVFVSLPKQKKRTRKVTLQWRGFGLNPRHIVG